jgi:hypothetical protein
MAGDWLKFEINTPEKREVLAMTVELGYDDPDLTVGKLLKVWRWFDQHTVDGNAASVTPALLDRLIGVSGITIAMVNVGWIIVFEGGLTLPNFARHNGKTAKARILTALRVANHKDKAKSNGVSVSSALPREEKRREEKNIKDLKTIHAPEGVSLAVWNDFVLQRKKSRAVISDNVINTIAKEAIKAGWTLEKALTEISARGWRGFKAEWVIDKPNAQTRRDKNIAGMHELTGGLLKPKTDDAIFKPISQTIDMEGDHARLL